MCGRALRWGTAEARNRDKGSGDEEGYFLRRSNNVTICNIWQYENEVDRINPSDPSATNIIGHFM